VAGVVAFYYQETIQGLIQPYIADTKEPELTKAPSPEELARQKAEKEDRRGREAEINRLLVEAEQAFTAGHYLEPPDNNALDHFLKVLELDPENAVALEGKQRVFDHFLQNAQLLIGEQHFEEAERALLKADIVMPDSRAIKLARLRLQEKKTEAKQIAMEEERIRLEEEQKQKAEEEAKQLAELEKQRQEEARRKAEAEQKHLEEEKRKEEERLAEAEQIRREEEARKKADDEKKEKYNLLIAEAGQAISSKDKELAISKYQEVLAIYPGDPNAESGLKEAEKMTDKACFAIVGEWQDSQYIADKLRVSADGTYEQYSAVAKYPGKWECLDPKSGKFKFTYEYNNWTADVVYQEAGCLQETGRMRKSCWKRVSKRSAIGVETTASDTDHSSRISENICKQIIGIWQWDNGSKSWFHENGIVKSTALFIKSEGNWECVDPENRIFTFNTWGKKREIKMSVDKNRIESVDAVLGTKITADRLSDNVLEETAPAQKTGTDITGR